jgi:preprotein translocase subunit YajC
MCRAALESSAEGRLVATSFAHGILMMLILPYVLFGIFGFAVYRAYRKKSKQRQETPSYPM